MTELSQTVLDTLTGILGETGLRHDSVHDTLDPGMHPNNLDAGVVALPVSKLSLMRSIKQTLDPKGIMNPGKVV